MREFHPTAGDNISDTAKEVVKLANTYKEIVEFDFNDVYIHVHPGDDHKKITKIYFDVINTAVPEHFQHQLDRWHRHPRGKNHIYSLHPDVHLPEDLFTI